MKENVVCVTVGDLATNCWLYAYDDAPAGPAQEAAARPCVVIDPGDEAGLILSRLKELNWIPRYIFLTHGHFDHLAALPDLLAALSDLTVAFGYALTESVPLPKIGIHPLDSHYLGKDALKAHRESFSAIGEDPAYVEALLKPLPVPDILFWDGGHTSHSGSHSGHALHSGHASHGHASHSESGPFKILHVPGHTKGSVAFHDEKAGVLFSGDTLFKRGRGRTDLPGGDEAEINKSLERLLSMDGAINVYPGHGPATTIFDEGPGYRD